MKNKEIIKKILEESNEYSEMELKKLSNSELSELSKLLTPEVEDVEQEDSIEEVIVEEDSIEEVTEKVVEEPKKVVVNLNKLSKGERRLYSRTGKLPLDINDRV